MTWNKITGLPGRVIDLATVGSRAFAVVATCAGLWTGDDGRLFFGADAFFVVRVAAATLDSSGQEAFERSVIAGYRWWSADELRRRDSRDVITPAGLSRLLDLLARGEAPAAPVRLPWRNWEID